MFGKSRSRQDAASRCSMASFQILSIALLGARFGRITTTEQVDQRPPNLPRSDRSAAGDGLLRRLWLWPRVPSFLTVPPLADFRLKPSGSMGCLRALRPSLRVST